MFYPFAYINRAKKLFSIRNESPERMSGKITIIIIHTFIKGHP